ncbi:hypothetical protein FHG64_05170 [Antarcticibacterium flavum]|uniref:Alpha/beta hydrolase n=1 Tax=Antarcticibacterium flavum TaxID=2058175 RepID=A0A5B7X2G7_9FLAO|nr:MULTISPECIES: YqiA/YcfP family alpha/beta fold hydrolase [Antarcticibacterium]MCM4159835.1 hypothetical protein [Antarcticibacterium sp. W02-3]QCY68838.1 hypothetical protein FHG64_05170 [Antarcticibacterium flavum]
MKIVYIHGLDSKLSPEKREILKKFGEVISPEVNYYQNPGAIATILQQLEGKGPDVIIGSSMGGFAAYYVSISLHKPALMFNPALAERTVEQEVPEAKIEQKQLKQFLLGAIDDVVNPGETLKFIAEAYNEHTDFHLHILPGLTHNIPLDVFEAEVRSFLEKV